MAVPRAAAEKAFAQSNEYSMVDIQEIWTDHREENFVFNPRHETEEEDDLEENGSWNAYSH